MSNVTDCGTSRTDLWLNVVPNSISNMYMSSTPSLMDFTNQMIVQQPQITLWQNKLKIVVTNAIKVHSIFRHSTFNFTRNFLVMK